MPTILLHPVATLAQFDAQTLLPTAAMLCIITGLLIAYRKRRRRQLTEPCLTPQEQLERNRQLRGVQGDLESLMVQIEQFSKRLAAQLDAKTIAVETLLKQADQRIAELKRLSSGDGQVEMSDVDPGLPGAAPAEPHRPAPAPADLPSDPLARSVYQLADQGLGPQAIAHRLGEHVGKVELILALRSA
jgi:hypothetical protein